MSGIWRIFRLSLILGLIVPEVARAQTVCNPGDNAGSFGAFLPASLTAGGPPQDVTIRVTNNGSTTWLREGGLPFAYRLGASFLSGFENQAQWSGGPCGGYMNSLTDGRLYLCNDVPPGATYDFRFQVAAPPGASGNLRLAVQMVEEAGDACVGQFGDIAGWSIPVIGGTTCPNSPLPTVNNQWKLETWNNRNLSGGTVEQRYESPTGNGGFNFNWNGVNPSACVGNDDYSLRLSRRLEVVTGATYNFTVGVDDGVRLRVDGFTLIDEWRDPQVGTFTASQFLGAGPHDIEVDYYEALGGAGVSLDWTTNATPTPPAPPSNLRAISGNSLVTLTWDPSNGATSYNLKRGTSSGFYDRTFANVSSPYPDTDVVNGQTYYYVATALNSDGESAPSNEVTATPNDTGSCTNSPLPTLGDRWKLEIWGNRDLAGTTVEQRYEPFPLSGGFDFDWASAPPSPCVGSDNYSVGLSRQITINNPANYIFTVVADDGVRLRVNGLTLIDEWRDPQVGTFEGRTFLGSGQHLVEVDYYQAFGGASVSLRYREETTLPPRPPAPTGLGATAGDSSVTLVWNGSSGADIYHVKRSTTPGGPYAPLASSFTTRYFDSSVTNGTTYYYIVTASNAGGESDPSNEASATPRAPTQPVTVQILDSRGNSVSALGLNGEGWPTPNPLTVRVTVRNVTAFSYAPEIDVKLIGLANRSRFFVFSRPDECTLVLADRHPGNEFSYFFQGSICALPALGPGESRTLDLGVWVQPSEVGRLDVSAVLRNANGSGNALADVPQARVHPVTFIHGVLGSMPPQNKLVTDQQAMYDVLDPFLGSYWPLLINLQKMGLVWNESLFALSYDWRQSIVDSANFLGLELFTVRNRAQAPYITPSDNKVDIYVHSMGGLVLRQYLQSPGYRFDVRKAIFIATPHRGFPFDYRTREGMTWQDYVYNAPLQGGLGLTPFLLDAIIWPTLVDKRFSPTPLELEAFGTFLPFQPGVPLQPYVVYHPGTKVILGLSIPGSYKIELDDLNTWSKNPARGARSLYEMLPDQRMPSYLANIFGPDPFGKEVNLFLENLNAPANVALFETRLGLDNIYAIYGDNAAETDRNFMVSDPLFTRPFWAFGAPHEIQEAPWGDDLVPAVSASLRRSGLLPGLPAAPLDHEARLDATQWAQPDPIVVFDFPKGARHTPIMNHFETQTKWVPLYLMGMEVPFATPYRAPLAHGNVARILDMVSACPVNLLITDPRGRRLGYDPVTGQVLREIPGAVYTSPNVEPQIVAIPNPEIGSYDITITGYGTGEYTVRTDVISGDGPATIALCGGQTTNGQIDSCDVVLRPDWPAPPQVTAMPDQNTNEGAVVSFNGSFTDPNPSDTHTTLWDFGDGSTAEATLAPTHHYADNGSYAVTLTVRDSTGLAGARSLTVAVVNVAPTVDAGPDLSVGTGAEAAFTGSFSDPGAADAHRLHWDFGDGSSADGTLNPLHTYAESGVYNVTLTVTDDDGGVGSDTLVVTVRCPDVFVERFDPYGSGADPAGWVDYQVDGKRFREEEGFRTARYEAQIVFRSREDDRASEYRAGGALSWHDYEWSGRLRLPEQDAADAFLFYSDVSTGRFYRINLERRGYELRKGFGSVLGRSTFVPKANVWNRFRIRVENLNEGTLIQARFWPEEEMEPSVWMIDVVDESKPLRAGTIAVVAGEEGVRIDDLRVEALAGAASGIVADRDGDGVCDGSDNCPSSVNPDQNDRDRDGSGDVCDACSAAFIEQELCLDSGYDASTGLSEHVVEVTGGTKHVSGHDECGVEGNYLIPAGGTLSFETPDLPETGRYRFELEIRGGSSHGLVPLRMEIEGVSYDVPLEFDYKPGAWQETREVEVTLGPGVHRVTLIPTGAASVAVEEVEIEEACAEEPAPGPCGEEQDMEACLDQGFDSKTKLSRWVKKVEGLAGHSTSEEDHCGPDGYYYVASGSGRLRVRVEVERAGRYALQFRYKVGTAGHKEESVRLVAGGRSFDFPDSALKNTNQWEKSRAVKVDLAKGENWIEFRSLGADSVHLEKVYLECECP